MKSLIVFLLLVMAATVGQAQHVTHLDEIKIDNKLIKSKIVKSQNEIIFKIDKARGLEFSKNPIAFMFNHFDIQDIISELESADYDQYVVTLKSRKGFMVANFNEDGKLLYTHQSFKNVLLPYDLRREIYNSYKGWTMTKNKYNATTKGEIINKETYRITLQNGNRKQNVKIDGNKLGTSVVSN